MSKIQISTNVPEEIVQQAKEKDIKLNYLFIRGWESINQETSASERIREAEEAIIKLQKQLTIMSTKYWELKDEVQKNG